MKIEKNKIKEKNKFLEWNKKNKKNWERKWSLPLRVKCLVKGVRGRRKILHREIIQRKMKEAIMRMNGMKVEIEIETPIQ